MPSILKFIGFTVIILAFISGMINWINDVAWHPVIEIWICGILFGVTQKRVRLISRHLLMQPIIK